MASQNTSIYSSVVALTGNIGSGKSTVLKIFYDLGVSVVSADELARIVVAPGSRTLRKVVDLLGTQILKSDGTLDRKQVAKMIFTDEVLKRKFEAILHPAIHAHALEKFKELISGNKVPIIYEVPLLFEANLDTLPFLATILVMADDALCLERTEKHRGLSKDDVLRRQNAQIPAAEKTKQVTFIIENNHDLENLRKQVTQVYAKILAKHVTQ